jgi:hypothetical protein
MQKAIFLFTTLVLIITAIVAPAQGLRPSQTELEWDGWDITITRLTFANSIKQSFGDPKTADSDSEFVYLSMTVRNSSHKGQSFIPQNNLKIVIDDNSFDAEDLDPSFDYVKNIEPTLSRTRECYFELPKSVVKDSFLLRFAGFFTDTSDVPVSIALARAPTARPFVQAVPQRIPPTSLPSAEQLGIYEGGVKGTNAASPLSDEEALSEFNALQDRNNLPHAKGVHYDYRTDSYNWIGPSKGRRMSLPRAEFESEMQD